MRNSCILLAAWLSPLLLSAQFPFVSQAEADLPYLRSLYEHFHRNPELSFQEQQTSRRMAEELRQAGFEVTEGIGGYGLAAVLRNGTGPCVMLRADMDALPVREETGLPYASTVTVQDATGSSTGVMHACGHDLHMTVLAGTARLLAAQRSAWRGTLLLVAQPAEERSGGAKAMLGDGLFARFPRPDAALALHANATLPAGSVGVCPEYALASVDMVDITVRGVGGHGAYPHTTKDPIVLAAQMILGFQTLVSREIAPIEPAVVTVGSIHGGSKGNVIPDEVRMELTVRAYDEGVRNTLLDGLRRMSAAYAVAAGLPADRLPVVTVRDESTPSLYNDPALTARAGAAFRRALGEAQVQQVPPVMGGEDFGRFGLTEPRVPICLFWLGTVAPERAAEAARGALALPSLHSPRFAPLPDPSIRTGVIAMSAAVLELLPKR
jgi:hippurate hydrolase